MVLFQEIKGKEGFEIIEKSLEKFVKVCKSWGVFWKSWGFIWKSCG